MEIYDFIEILGFCIHIKFLHNHRVFCVASECSIKKAKLEFEDKKTHEAMSSDSNMPLWFQGR